MEQGLSRRQLLCAIIASGLAGRVNLYAQEEGGGEVKIPKGKKPEGDISRKSLAHIRDGRIIQPAQDIPVIKNTGVLVIGGGTAGICAAIAAKRLGVETILIERYGQLGGVFTAGISPLITGISTADGKTRVLQGIGGEVIAGLQKLENGIIGSETLQPVADVETAKFLFQTMIQDAGVELIYHSWCTDVIKDGNVTKGAVFASKQGYFAITANVIVDATGDGDVLAFAGAAHSASTSEGSLGFRIGNLDKLPEFQNDAAAFREKLNAALKANDKLGNPRIYPTPLTDVDWVSQAGVKINPLNVEDLTKAELLNRNNAWETAKTIRNNLSRKEIELIEVAWLLGIPVTRTLEGVEKLAVKNSNSLPGPNSVGVCPGIGGGIPYGILLPKEVTNLIVCGRAVSAHPPAADALRTVSGCMITGHAAGVGAALAAKSNTTPGEVDVAKVRSALKTQGAFLG